VVHPLFIIAAVCFGILFVRGVFNWQTSRELTDGLLYGRLTLVAAAFALRG
jgi:hypothetical protein